MSEQLSANAPLTTEAAPPKAGIGSSLKVAGAFAFDVAKRAWRIDAVKSAAVTWAIRASIPGAAILAAIIDSYVG